ncbi:MAG: galactokinase [Clostridiales bacterium]|nr:galactokinase [Clostridiales bacterium]
MHRRIFSAPGRVEIGGNHTDHQHGRVLAAAINLHTKCYAKPNGTNIVKINSDGFGESAANLESLAVNPEEYGKTSALIRGVAAWFNSHGYKTGGFDAEVYSDVPGGAGLSSSAAFEVMIGNVFKYLFESDVSALDIAIAGQYAENVYFGKPCGLMDQTASSFGGLCMIDFLNPDLPQVTAIEADFTGYSICVVKTGTSHEDLTADYALIPDEMKSAAKFFGEEYLRDVDAQTFYGSIGQMKSISDRAKLRAFHFFGENERVLKQAQALKNGDMREFFSLVKQSGFSSFMYLQNIYSASNPKRQELALALALSDKILNGTGAYRVHGGGFGGTILAFVPDKLKDEYEKTMNGVFGAKSCIFLSVRKEGGVEVVL